MKSLLKLSTLPEEGVEWKDDDKTDIGKHFLSLSSEIPETAAEYSDSCSYELLFQA